MKKIIRKKPKVKSIAKLQKEVWNVFALLRKLENSWDGKHCKCISCGKTLTIGTTDCQAGHLHNWGNYPVLRFNKDNVFPQCYRCNIPLDGNKAPYSLNLIDFIGLERVRWLDEHKHDKYKPTRSELIEMKVEFEEDLEEIKEKWS